MLHFWNFNKVVGAVEQIFGEPISQPGLQFNNMVNMIAQGRRCDSILQLLERLGRIEIGLELIIIIGRRIPHP